MSAKRVNPIKGKAKEAAPRQQTLFAHFKAKPRSPSAESEESAGLVPVPTIPPAIEDSAASQFPQSSLSPTPDYDITFTGDDGKQELPETPTSRKDVSIIPPSSPLSIATNSPIATTSSSPEIVAITLPESPLKPIHPFFARASKVNKPLLEPILILDSSPPLEEKNSSLAPPKSRALRRGYSYECPIVVDSSPVKPSSHSTSRPVLNVTHPRSGQGEPPLSPKKFHPLFQPRAPKSRAGSPFVVDRSTPLQAPFPDSDSQHVKGPQQCLMARSHSFSHRIITQEGLVSPPTGLGVKLDDDVLDTTRGTFTPVTSTTEAKLSYLLSIPRAHSRSHPSIGRIVSSLGQNRDISRLKEGSAQILWSDRWRPSRADEVLGNEQSALYLRDWLSALQLQITPIVPMKATPSSPSTDGQIATKPKKSGRGRGTKRPRVIRAVDNKKSRKKRRVTSDDEDDWIVADGFSESEFPPEDNEDEDLFPTRRIYRRDPSPINTASYPQPIYSFGDSLSNTILLVGPPGVGKTAAVYACAEELGWDVFEVYPGIGRRGGTNLDNLIGEVGKSHLVGKTSRRNGDSSNAGPDIKETGFFGKRNGTLKHVDSKRAEDSPTGVLPSNFGFLTESLDEPLGNGHIRQSIVLLEEVDILFKDDTGFWPAVTNFIRECRRPVICTCNDPTLVPINDLPLQATLYFDHPETAVAVSYLQAVCCAEGSLVERQHLSHLYETTYPVDEVDIPDSKVTGPPSMFPHPDIRRAMNNLQLWFAGNGCPGRTASKVRWQDSYQSVEDLLLSGGTVEVPETAEAGSARAPFHAEFLSYVDSHLLRHPKDSAEALWSGTTEVTQDDEIGHMALVRPARSLSEHDGLGMYDRDMLIAEDAIRRARGLVDTKTIVDQGMFRARELFRARVEYHSQVVAVLGKVVPEAILERPVALHVEYGPWVRHMVAGDDAQEAYALSQSRGGRTTRNSLGYVRSVALGPSERDSLLQTGFEVI